MNLNLKQLKGFIALNQCKNFTDAAELIHTSQPTLSTMIRQLESSLHCTLFQRSTRRVDLTEAGQLLLPVAEEVIRKLESIATELHDFDRHKEDTVSLSMILSLGSSLIPKAIAEFKKSYPHLTINITEEPETPTYRKVRNGELDFGITALTDDHDGLTFQPLFRDPLWLACSENSTFAKRTVVSWQEIAHEQYIAIAEGSHIRELMQKGFATADCAFNPSYEAVYFSTVTGMILNGMGVSVIPGLYRGLFHIPGIKYITIENTVWREMGILTHTDQPQSRMTESLIHHLTQFIHENAELLPGCELSIKPMAK